MKHTEYLYLVEYERNGTRYVLPIYQIGEEHAIRYANEWGARLHIEIIGVKQASQWVIRSGAVLPGSIEVD